MDKLKKSQKDEYATAYAILALYDGGAEITSDQVNTLLEATGNKDVEGFYPIIFTNFLNTPEKIAKIIASPSAGGGGGGGGGGGTFQDCAITTILVGVFVVFVVVTVDPPFHLPFQAMSNTTTTTTMIKF
jgi:hypothetical protein